MSNKEDEYRVLERIIEELHESRKRTDSFKESLEESGIDSKKSVERGLDRLRKIKANAMLEKGKERNQLFQKALDKLRDFKEKEKNDIENPIQYLLDSLSKPNQENVKAFHRKIESLDEEEALQLLEDTKLLELIEKIEESENDESS